MEGITFRQNIAGAIISPSVREISVWGETTTTTKSTTATEATATLVAQNDYSHHTSTGVERNGQIQKAAITKLKVWNTDCFNNDIKVWNISAKCQWYAKCEMKVL